jgi:hypothetical protein
MVGHDPSFLRSNPYADLMLTVDVSRATTDSG